VYLYVNLHTSRTLRTYYISCFEYIYIHIYIYIHVYIYIISTIKNIFYRDIPLVWSLLLSAWAPVARCCRSWWPEKRWSCQNNRNTSQRPAGKFAEWGERSQYYDHLPRYIYIYVYLSIYLSIYGSVRIFH
jgi:hypothetical protein